MKRLIGIMVLCLAGPALAAPAFPPEGVYGDKQGCKDYVIGTEGSYFGFDKDGKGWGGYGEVNCKISSVKKSGEEFLVKSTCHMIDNPEGYPADIKVKILSPGKKIMMDGEVYNRCPEPPAEAQ